MELYIIYGLPGVGKLAVARELMHLLPSYRLFHIHQLAYMLESVFGFDGRGFIGLRNLMWPMVIERAVADGITGLITTFVFEKSLPDEMVPNVRDHVIEAGGKVRFVHLTCEKAENDHRLTSPERTHFRKMTSVDEFQPNYRVRSLHNPGRSGRYTDTRYDTPDRCAGRAENRQSLGVSAI